MEDGISTCAAEPLRILVAEDEPAYARLLFHALRKGGHTGDLVGDGEALLQAVEKRRYDVLLIDLRIPRLGGLEAAAWIRQHHTDADRPLLIAVTSESDAQGPEWTRRNGFDAHFTKPINTGALLDALARVPRRRSLPASA